ncbi:MAG: hypothetical protein ACI8T1_000039 [Verrucomicrobiales bacterium]
MSEVFSKLVWIADDDDFQLLYDSRVGWRAEEGTSSASETFSVATANRALYVTTSRKQGNVNRNEGFIGRYENGMLADYATRARLALIDGSDTAFSHSFVRASDVGALSLSGSDGRFPHFIVRATEGSAVVLAQENVTDFPGTAEKFSPFNPQTEISAKGTAMAFRGQTASGLQGLCLWTEAQGIQLVVNTTMTLPGREEPFNTFIDSSILCRFGAGGELYLFNSAPKAVVVHQDGTLNPVVAQGDQVADVEIKKLERFDVAPTETCSFMTTLALPIRACFDSRTASGACFRDWRVHWMWGTGTLSSIDTGSRRLACTLSQADSIRTSARVSK